MASCTWLPDAGSVPQTTTNLFHLNAISNATTLLETLLDGGNVLAKLVKVDLSETFVSLHRWNKTVLFFKYRKKHF